jgi:hypothetical protein
VAVRLVHLPRLLAPPQSVAAVGVGGVHHVVCVPPAIDRGGACSRHRHADADGLEQT